MYYIYMFLFITTCEAVIYKMNESEYNRMPPLFHLDDFDSCLLEPGGTYCVLDVDLHGDNDLMRMIRGYSEHTVKHFNHTQIHRGVCVTHTCRQYYEANTTGELSHILEACLNETLWNEYGIEGRVAKLRYCKREGERVAMDESDVIVAVVYLVLILMNAIGTGYDILFYEKGGKGNTYLLSFSLRRNWSRLVAPISSEREPRLERLKMFHGMRSMTMICVFFSHTVLVMAHSYVANPYYIEKAYEDPIKQILFNGSLVTHTFFVMSAFLLAYNFQLQSERHAASWLHWPKGMLLRWLRLTPTYALILATICTLMRYLGSGPVWDLVVTSEADACRQYWWAHIFYVNNYVYNDIMCAPQTWYLAADTQLFGLGLLVCILARKPKSQALWLSGLFVVALVISAAHTYFQDLDAVVIQTPESYRNLYAHDDTFRLLYIRGHTNMSTYILGLAGGFLAYHWQTQRKNFDKFKNYRWVFWLIFPCGVAVILSGGVFYTDGTDPPIAFKILYAILYKPIFQTLVVSLIIGNVFKFETVYRSVMEWRGFTWMGRLTYSGFLLHMLFQRGLVGVLRQPVYLNDYFVMIILAGTTLVTYLCAAALWLFVEAPLTGIIKTVLGGDGDKKEEKKEEVAGENAEEERSKV